MYDSKVLPGPDFSPIKVTGKSGRALLIRAGDLEKGVARVYRRFIVKIIRQCY